CAAKRGTRGHFYPTRLLRPEPHFSSPRLHERQFTNIDVVEIRVGFDTSHIGL
ncbi:hypothetical protein E4U54_002898, partial [Claviceps lovelessii]